MTLFCVQVQAQQQKRERHLFQFLKTKSSSHKSVGCFFLVLGTCCREGFGVKNVLVAHFSRKREGDTARKAWGV